MTDLAAIRAVWERATKGPWKDRPSVHGNKYRYVEIDKKDEYTTLEMKPDDARFIAASWAYVRDLLALAERLEKENGELRAALEPFASSYNADHWHSCLSLDNLRTARDALARAKEP